MSNIAPLAQPSTSTSGNVTPAVQHASGSKRTGAPSSDEMATFMALQPYAASYQSRAREDGNREVREGLDLRATAWAHTVGTRYFGHQGYTAATHDGLAKRIGISKETLAKGLVPRLEEFWEVTSGGDGHANHYAPRPEVSATLEGWRKGEGADSVPTRISPEFGIQPELHSQHKRLEFEPIDVSELAGQWYVPGTKEHLAQFMHPGLTPARALALAGVKHSRRIAFIMGELAYPSEQSRGLSILLGNMMGLTTGWASASPEWFTKTLGLSRTQRQKLRNDLIASGLWRVYKDRGTGQEVFLLTPFALAQMSAYEDLRRRRDAITGKASGYRIEVVNHLPWIGRAIATKATAFGVNDLIGLKGMTTENPLAPSPGTVYRRDLEAPTLRAKQAQTKTGGTASLSLLGGYASNSPLGYAVAI